MENWIQLNAHTFADQLKKIKPFISKEETRFYLCGVCFICKDQQLKIVATNGHILCEISLNETSVYSLPAGTPDFEAILPAEDVHFLIQMLTYQWFTQEEDQLVDEDDNGEYYCKYEITWTLEFKVIEHEERKSFVFKVRNGEYTCRAIDYKFPDYEKVLPKGTQTVAAHFNAGYLIDVLNAFGGEPVSVFVDDLGDAKNLPHLIQYSEKNGVRCAIMSMRAS